MLIDLFAAVRPALTIMDAVVGMDGPGPRNGNPKRIGAILAGPDAVALDAVACEMVGVPALSIATTRLANEQGVGIGDVTGIEILGEPLGAMRIDGFEWPVGAGPSRRIEGVFSFLRGRLVAKPVVVPDKCEGCWVCMESCPPEAISKDGRVPVFDYGKCIHCYCCQELCPSDAIRLRQPFLRRFF